MNKTLPEFNRNQLILLVSGGIVLLLLLYALVRDTTETVSLHNLEQIIENGQVEKAYFDDHYLYIMSTNSGSLKIERSQVPVEITSQLIIEPKKGYGWVWFGVLLGIIGSAIGWVYKTRDNEKSNEETEPVVKGKATEEEPVANTVFPVKSNVRFSDIGGISDVKEELEEIIDFLKNPKRYYNFGARMPRGVLLVGPPGVGKTMIAKAVAAEADVPFFYQSGASFVQIYVGMGAKRVHELFASAKKNAPAIIFIDEIDAVGKKRDGTRNDEREGTLNQLLTEMDGFEETSGIIVIAATNNIDVMDSALLRAGRFDRRIFVELPTASERESILEKYLQHIPHDLSMTELAKMTVGFNGASLAALVNEAALLCIRQREIQVKMEHFTAVKDKVMFGKKKITILNEKQRKYHTYYQAAKAFAAGWFDLPFEKITLSSESVTPPSGEPMLQHEIEANIRIHLAGMAACELRFGEHASNVSHDLQSARELVSKMVNDYGMGSSLIPSDSDEAVLMERYYTETKTLLEERSNAVEKIEHVLDEYEQISKTLIGNIIHEVS